MFGGFTSSRWRKLRSASSQCKASYQPQIDRLEDRTVLSPGIGSGAFLGHAFTGRLTQAAPAVVALPRTTLALPTPNAENVRSTAFHPVSRPPTVVSGVNPVVVATSLPDVAPPALFPRDPSGIFTVVIYAR
jgi:hypothetical protein